jgi:hypothetical protein
MLILPLKKTITRSLKRSLMGSSGAVVPSMSYKDTVLASSPRLYWDMHLPDPSQHLCPDVSGHNLGGDVFYVKRSAPGAILTDPANTGFTWDGTGNGAGDLREFIESNGLEGSGFATGGVLGIDGASASWTVECWIYPTTTHNWLGAWQVGVKAAGQYVALMTGGNDQRLYLHTWGLAGIGTGVAVPWDTYTLVHVSYDHTTQILSVFLNGEATSRYTVSAAINLPTSGWSFQAGRLDANQWLGHIDDTAVYDKVLTAGERMARYVAAGYS